MKNKSIILLILSLVLSCPLKSQTDVAPMDKFTLLTMPYNKRQLTMYRGQFQLNAGYKFAIRSRSYDKEGNLIILKDVGTASVYHYYMLELKYGITNFLELSAQTNYLKRGVRSVTQNYFASSVDAITVNTVNETRGLGDVLLLGSLRLPLEYKWFDFRLSGGVFLPTAGSEPEKPSHAVSNITATDAFTVDLYYKNKNGYGVPVWLVAGATKFTLKRFSLEADFTYRKPFGEGENIRWDEELTVDKTFTYNTEKYDYLLNSSCDANASLHYQATGWFNIGLNSGYFYSGGGWTEYWGDKYRNRPQHVFTLEPKMEIQISPTLKIYEVVGFPLAGTNIDGPFYIFMTVSLNAIPFFR
jgi:hypothetical protein